MRATAALQKQKETRETNGQHVAAPRGRRDPLSDLFMGLQRTADRLMQGLEDALRPTGFTPVQYLVLRSLRQAGAVGMPSNQIVRYLTTHDPDLTRLLDKLEKKGIVERRRDRTDRRVYRVSLTREGARQLNKLSKLTRGLHREQFNTINRRNVETLGRLLDNINEAPIPEMNDDD